MDDYVVVRQPNNHIVLGVNDDRPEHVYIVQFDEGTNLVIQVEIKLWQL